MKALNPRTTSDRKMSQTREEHRSQAEAEKGAIKVQRREEQVHRFLFMIDATSVKRVLLFLSSLLLFSGFLFSHPRSSPMSAMHIGPHVSAASCRKT